MENTYIINDVLSQVINNFDFAYMLIINVLTYMIIKIIDYFNGDKKVNTWLKRVILCVSIIIIATIYVLTGYENKIILLNSTIIAPVFWSWILKPILKKLGIDYKQESKE